MSYDYNRISTSSDSLVTKEYIQQLKDVVQKDPSTFWSSPRPLARLFSDLDYLDPLPITELAEYLTERGVDADEVKRLIKIKPKKVTKTLDFYDAFILMEKTLGISVIFDGRIEQEPWVPPVIIQWVKSFKKLKAIAKKVSKRYVKKIKLGLPRGSEDASWNNGILELCLKPGHLRYDASTLAFFITHELGHALETRANLFAPPWGEPPFISEYAKSKPNIEDFAESFAFYVVEPTHLKKTAPEKYEALRSLVGTT